MKDPFEEQQRLIRRAMWAIRNPHIILAASASIVLLFNFGHWAIFS